MDLGLKLEETHVLVTGGSGYIGIATVDALLAAGCYVTSLDIKEPDPKLTANSNFRYHYCDITSEDSLEGTSMIHKSHLDSLGAALHWLV
jgi:NAD(P)-dependent dehydrogenase (short-subunit alcohol dehydrogenase family)